MGIDVVVAVNPCAEEAMTKTTIHTDSTATIALSLPFSLRLMFRLVDDAGLVFSAIGDILVKFEDLKSDLFGFTSATRASVK